MNIAVTTHFCSSSYSNVAPATKGDENNSTKTTVLSQESFDESWIAKCVQNKKQYCEINDYIFIDKQIDTMPVDRNISWYKISNLLDIMEDDSVDWIFQTDFDSLIMRDDIKLEDIIGRAETFGKKAIFPNQIKGLYSDPVTGKLTWSSPAYCAGHFLIKNCKWSKALLKKLWEFPEHSVAHNRIMHGKYWEQCAINIFLKTNTFCLKDNSFIVKNKVLNSFMIGSTFESKSNHDELSYSEGDFLIHFAGLNFEQRSVLVDEYLHRKDNKDKSTWKDIDWAKLVNGMTYEKLREKEKMLWLINEALEIPNEGDSSAGKKSMRPKEPKQPKDKNRIKPKGRKK